MKRNWPEPQRMNIKQVKNWLDFPCGPCARVFVGAYGLMYLSKGGRTLEKLTIPEWAWEFHGHHCPFMPIGFRMGTIALRELGIGKVADYGVYALPEIGIGHPQTCMADGIQVATGCTYGKMLMERTDYGTGKSPLLYLRREWGRSALRPRRVFRTPWGLMNFLPTANGESNPRRFRGK